MCWPPVAGHFANQKPPPCLIKNAIVVWLQASPDTLLKRIGDTTSRPLLQTGPPLEDFAAIANRPRTILPQSTYPSQHRWSDHAKVTWPR